MIEKNMAERLLYLDNRVFNRPYDDQSLPGNYLQAEAKIDIDESEKITGRANKIMEKNIKSKDALKN